MSSEKDLKVKCPHCRKEFFYKTSPFRPFCSEKCKMIDLGMWLEEAYNIEEKIEDEFILQHLSEDDGE